MHPMTAVLAHVPLPEPPLPDNPPKSGLRPTVSWGGVVGVQNRAPPPPPGGGQECLAIIT